jgi:hypothetical protein
MLRGKLAESRLEKANLYVEINSPLTEPLRKQEAMMRYATLVNALGAILREPEEFVAGK